jgi:hypothetical protein
MRDGWYTARFRTFVALCETPIEMLFLVDERSNGTRLYSSVEGDLHPAYFPRLASGRPRFTQVGGADIGYVISNAGINSSNLGEFRTQAGQRREAPGKAHKRLLYCVNVNRTSLDHLLLGGNADVNKYVE